MRNQKKKKIKIQGGGGNVESWKCENEKNKGSNFRNIKQGDLMSEYKREYIIISFFFFIYLDWKRKLTNR